jgi:alpha-1,6-mannosyltransferase
MSSDASTFPLRDAPAERPPVKRRFLRGRTSSLTRSGEREWLGAVCLAVIVLCSLLVVVVAANRPSILSATSHANYFPHWMTGPLGGLLPGLTRSSVKLKYLFSAAIVAMYVSYALGLVYVPRLRSRWAIATVIAVHFIFFLAPPLALTDIFNYVNYGRMEAVHNLNPYTTIPILEPHSDPSYDLSNWHQLLSPYGPLFTIFTFVVVPLGVAASFWVLKGCLALASLGTIWLVWKCAKLLGRDPVKAIVLVGLNPIVLVWGLGGDHNDFLMVFLVVLGFYLLLLARQRDHEALGEDGVDPLDGPFASAPPPVLPASLAAARAVVAEVPLRTRLREWLLPLSWPEIAAGAAFVAAVAVKASGAVLIPVLLAALLRMPRRLAQVLLGMVVTTAAIAVASLIAFGLHFPDLSTQSKLVTSVSVPNLIGLALGQGGETDWLHTLLSAALIIAVALCCVQAWRRRSAITASGWASVALLVTLSWVLPWYVLWVLPMAALSSSRRLRVTALVLGVYLIIAWAPASGQLWNAIHFHPEKTSLGRLHQRYVKELLN